MENQSNFVSLEYESRKLCFITAFVQIDVTKHCSHTQPLLNASLNISILLFISV